MSYMAFVPYLWQYACSLVQVTLQLSETGFSDIESVALEFDSCEARVIVLSLDKPLFYSTWKKWGSVYAFFCKQMSKHKNKPAI